jgi:hypothetical protein
MLFSSRDAQHYQPGQGTQLLQEIAQMLPGLLALSPPSSDIATDPMAFASGNTTSSSGPFSGPR